METLRNIRMTFRRNLPLFAGVCLFVYFLHHTFSGNRSYSELSRLSTTLEEKISTLDTLTQESTELQEKVSMMRSSSLSADMLEEQARFILGYKFQDEIVFLED